MDGVTIVQTIEMVEKTWGWNPNILWFLIPLTCGILAIFFGIHEYEDWAVICGSILFAITLGAVYMAASTATEIPQPTRYVVVVNDDVVLNEFNQHYKIVESIGGGFIVEERPVE